MGILGTLYILKVRKYFHHCNDISSRLIKNKSVSSCPSQWAGCWKVFPGWRRCPIVFKDLKIFISVSNLRKECFDWFALLETCSFMPNEWKYIGFVASCYCMSFTVNICCIMKWNLHQRRPLKFELHQVRKQFISGKTQPCPNFSEICWCKSQIVTQLYMSKHHMLSLCMSNKVLTDLQTFAFCCCLHYGFSRVSFMLL